MKKSIAIFAALAISAGMTFAQNNDAIVKQEVNMSEVTVNQTGADNTADVHQKHGQYHETMIGQLGNANDANVYQDNTNTYTSIQQTGDANTADIFQRSRLFVGPNNVAASIELEQTGNQNNANIRQDAEAAGGGSKTNVADVKQLGNLNEVNIDQKRFTGSGYNEVNVFQNGIENIADVDQTGASNAVLIQQGLYGGAERSSAVFVQNGENNYFETKMVSSYDNTVTGNQLGDNNFYRVGVRGSDNNVSMDMVGDANRGSWTIGTLGWPHQPEGNELSIDVEGDGNITSGSILGDHNEVTLIQEGNDNMIGTNWHAQDGVHIQGHMNTVSVGQFTDGNSSMNTVVGNSNIINVVQQ